MNAQGPTTSSSETAVPFSPAIQDLIYSLQTNSSGDSNVGSFLKQAVHQIQQTLGYYHVQVYLLDHRAPISDRLILHSGTGEAGRIRELSGYSLPINARRSLVAQAAREKAPVIVNDTRQSLRFLPHTLLPETRAEAAFPLLSQDQLLGVLDVQHNEIGSFTPYEQSLLQILADQLTSVLVRDRLQQHTERLNQHLAGLRSLTMAAAAADDENDLIHRATQIIKDTLQADNAGFRLVDHHTGNLRSHESYQKTIGRERALKITGPGEGITGRVLDTGKPWRVADTSQEPAFLGDPAIRSELCVPLLMGNHVTGVINVESKHQNAFSETDEAFLVTAAAQLSTVLQNIRLAETFQRQLEEKDALLTTLKAVSSLQVDDVLNTLAQEAQRRLLADSSRIYLLEPDEETLTCAVIYSDTGATIRQFSLKVGQGITGSVALSGIPEIVPNTRYDRRAFYIPGTPMRDDAAMFAPIKLRQTVLGVMSVHRFDVNHPFSPTDLNLFVTIADQAAIALANARLVSAEKRKRQELSVLHKAAAIIAEAINEDDMLDRLTSLIGEKLYPDGFGFLLLDEAQGFLHPHASFWGTATVVATDNSIAGFVVHTGKPYRSGDILQEKRFSEAQFYEADVPSRSRLCVPLEVAGEIIGVLNAAGKEPNAFSQADEQLLITLANQIATGLEKLRLLEKEQQRVTQQQVLVTVAETVLTALNLPDLWTAVSQASQKLLHADKTAVFLSYPESNTPVCAYAKNLSSAFVDGLIARFNQAPDSQALHTQKPLFINNALTHSQTNLITDLIEQEGIHSYALFPLKFNWELQGFIAVYRTKPTPFNREDEITGQVLAQIVTIAQQNVQRYTERSFALFSEKKFSEFLSRIHEEQDLPTILSNVLYYATSLIGAEAGVVGLILDNSLMTYYPYNIHPDLGLEPAARGRGVAWHIVETGESVILANYKQHPSAMEKWVQTGVQAFLGVPLVTPEGIQGVLCLVNMASPKPFQEGDRLLAESIARQAGLALYEIRRYEEAIQRLNQLAVSLARQEEADRAKDAFIQTLTHELRTPLGIVMGHAELLESGILGDLQPSQQESIRIITRRLRMINDVFDNLNFLLTMEKDENRHKLIQPQQLVNAIVAEFQLHAVEASLTLETEIPENLPDIYGDPTQMHRVFDNLLSNAMKFTPAGGQVKIRAARKGNYVVFQVIDDGIGMPVNQSARVFERFYQVRDHKNMNPYGVGLGLALVKEIVEAHGGTVKVESAEGQGSVFEIALPVAR